MDNLISKDTLKAKLRSNLKERGILVSLILLWVVFFFTNENFRVIDSYLSILREASFVGVAAIGMTFCIIIKAIDLSIGAMVGLLALFTVSIIGEVGLIPTVIIIVISGALLGAINGFLYSKFRVPAFIATLGMSYIYNAVALIYSKGRPIQFNEKWFTVIGNGNFIGLPVPFIIFIILAILGSVILKKTILGRQILSVGNSEKASYLSGIDTMKVKIFVFALVGMFTAIASILISSRMWSANAEMKVGYEFDVIAAVVLGGTSLKGGKGSILNTTLASIFFASIYIGMNMFHVDAYMQKVVEGIILVVAFSIGGDGKLIKAKLKGNKVVNTNIT
ncbi:ABC transporter permease [Clostridium lacusfryxellense]|uniref:ABC transporter permease n=1 Tax=Clostridium lacusfryxellense TaxID=205328 RepID=UPI001C0D30F5|nr:ABC transporter permease [Clostridium lacusfryxellense]MBU3112733.1 ABC transporter permease [Clostridium lacusfryxellense]